MGSTVLNLIDYKFYGVIMIIFFVESRDSFFVWRGSSKYKENETAGKEIARTRW